MAALAQASVEQSDVDAGRNGGGERRAHLSERHDQREIEDQVHRDRDGRELHWGGGVRPRVEAWGQHFHQNIGGQADRKGGKRLGAGAGVFCRKGTMLEDRGDDRLATDDQSDGGRKRQEQGEFEAAVLGVHRLGFLAPPKLLR